VLGEFVVAVLQNRYLFMECCTTRDHSGFRIHTGLAVSLALRRMKLTHANPRQTSHLVFNEPVNICY
jgi:hypothetical protein